MTDLDLASAIKTYMLEHKYCSTWDIRKKLNTSSQRIERLAKEGLIQPPNKMSRSIAATLNRKRNKISKDFYINRPAPWQ